MEYLLKKRPDEKSYKADLKNTSVTIKRGPAKTTDIVQQITENKKMSTSNSELKFEPGERSISEDNKFLKPTAKRIRRKRITKNNTSDSGTIIFVFNIPR